MALSSGHVLPSSRNALSRNIRNSPEIKSQWKLLYGFRRAHNPIVFITARVIVPKRTLEYILRLRWTACMKAHSYKEIKKKEKRIIGWRVSRPKTATDPRDSVGNRTWGWQDEAWTHHGLFLLSDASTGSLKSLLGLTDRQRQPETVLSSKSQGRNFCRDSGHPNVGTDVGRVLSPKYQRTTP